VVIPSVRKPLTAPPKGTAKNRKFNSGKYFEIQFIVLIGQSNNTVKNFQVFIRV